MNNGSGKLVPSSFEEAVSTDLEKDDVFSWSESHNGVKLWRFAPEDKGIEYSQLNDSESDNGLKARSFLPSSSQELFMEKPEEFQESIPKGFSFL